MSLSKIFSCVAALTCLAGAAWLTVNFLFASPEHEPLFGKISYGLDTKNADASFEIIVQGNKIYFDVNGNGETEAAELYHSEHPFKLPLDGGELIVENSSLLVAPESVLDGFKQSLMVATRVSGKSNSNEDFKYSMIGKIELAPKLEDARTIHFGGPLEFLLEKDVTLKATSKEQQF
ncbi:MAG: hypothetical protein AAGA30_14865, partial [Planctomycetota bacterium]